MKETITISLEEYKELLEIKGKYTEHQCKTIEYVPASTPYCPNPYLPEWGQTTVWY